MIYRYLLCLSQENYSITNITKFCTFNIQYHSLPNLQFYTNYFLDVSKEYGSTDTVLCGIMSTNWSRVCFVSRSWRTFAPEATFSFVLVSSSSFCANSALILSTSWRAQWKIKTFQKKWQISVTLVIPQRVKSDPKNVNLLVWQRLVARSWYLEIPAN